MPFIQLSVQQIAQSANIAFRHHSGEIDNFMAATPNILVLYAHPAPHRSRVNRLMVAAAGELPNVTVRDLYQIYPDFHIDIRKEQALLAAADLIVFQHPIQWYGMPSLLKEWADVVLEHGWAYGEGGKILHGKGFLLAATTGSGAESYASGASQDRSFEAFLPPFRQTAALCGMRWLPPLILHSARRADDEAVAAHVVRYRELLASWPHWPTDDSTGDA